MVDGGIQEANSDGAETSSCRLQDACLSLSERQLPHQGVFYPLGYSIEIITNNRSLLEAAQQSFGGGLPRQIHRFFEPEIGFNLRSC
jgi:hypothetical protein